MVFGKWKDDLYMLISRTVRGDGRAAIAWISQVEHAQSVEQMAGDPAPFTALDAILKGQIQKRLQGLQLVQLKRLKSQYMTKGDLVNGRKVLWIRFQKVSKIMGNMICG